MSKTMMLACELTNEERRERGIELAERVARLADLQQAKKDAAKAAKDEIDQVEEGVLDLGRVVRAGKEDRPVEVIERFDVKARQVHTIRTDLQEIVQSRAMTVAEYEEHAQVKLFAHEGAKPGDELAPEKKRGAKKGAESA